MMLSRLLLFVLVFLLSAAAAAKKHWTATMTKAKEDKKGDEEQGKKQVISADSTRSSTPYYKHVGDVDHLHSASIIRALPVMHFFDHDKRSFKTGFLGQRMLALNQSLFQDLVSIIDKKFIQNSKIEVVKDLPVVDYSSIFFHYLAALRGTTSLHEKHQQRIRKLYDNLATRKFTMEVFENRTINGTKTFSSLRMYNDVLDKKMSTLATKAKHEEMKTSNSKMNAEYYRDEMKKKITQLYEYINEKVNRKTDALSILRIKRMDEVLDIFNGTEMKRLESELEEIDLIRGFTLAHMHEQNIREVELGKFRLAEEMRMAQGNEQVLLNIQAAKVESSMIGFAAVVKFITSELANVYTSFISNPKQTFMYISLILLVFVSTIIFYEFVVSFRFIVAQLWSDETSRFIRSPVRSKETLVFPEKLEEKMKNFLDLVTHSSSQHGPLPIMLLYGKAGSGKSSTAEYLASRCTLPAHVVSVSDVLARDPKEASLFFRKITAGSNKYGTEGFNYRDKKSKRQKLIVLDGADELIESRGLKRKGTDSESSAGCFYTLLEAARSASRDLSIVLTSRLNPSNIDGALMDRVDFLCQLTPPNALVRFKYILKKIEECFIDIMDEESKNSFLDITKSEKLEECFNDIVSKHGNTEFLAPETTVPETSHPSSSSSPSSSSGTVYMISDVSTTSFDIKLCINSLVSHSEGRSYRDIAKFILNTQLLVLGTADCCIRDIHFMQELRLFLSNLEYYSSGS